MLAPTTPAARLHAAARRNRPWARRLDEPPTTGQLAFDLAFGVVLPALCLRFDLLVFDPSGPLADWQVFGWAGFAAAALTLGGWRIAGRRHPRAGGVAGGILLGAAVAAACVDGVVLLRLGRILAEWPATALLCSPVGLALFAIPLLAAFVYGRAAAEALRRARDGAEPAPGWAPLVGALLLLSLAACAQVVTTSRVARAVERVEFGTGADVDAALADIRWLRPWCRDACSQPLRTLLWDRALAEILTGDVARGARWLRDTPGCRQGCAERLVSEYLEGFPRDRARLGAAYRQLAGEEIDKAVQRREEGWSD